LRTPSGVGLTEANARTSAVLRNKRYAGCFQCCTQLLNRRNPRVSTRFKPIYSGLSDVSGAGKIGCAPIERGPGHSTLSRRHIVEISRESHLAANDHNYGLCDMILIIYDNKVGHHLEGSTDKETSVKFTRNDIIASPRSRQAHRRQFIGGSEARIIMSADEAALIRLWKEKRGEAEPEDLSENLVVQLGVVTEELNRTWYERNTGRAISDIQRWVQHPVHRFLAATLDGFVNDIDTVFEAKFMLPWSFSEEAAAEKHMAQLQHNMWVTNARSAALSIITGGGKWIEMTIPADALYQHFLITAERRFWRCVQTGETPRPYGIEPPRPRVEAVRIVDMSESNSWAEFAGLLCATRSAFLDHERAKAELKALMPEDAKEATGHGVRAKRSKSGAVSFDLLEQRDSHAAG
jgi:YqaJ-like viral recombinase domain